MEAITTFRKVKFHFDNVHFKVPLEFGPYFLAQAGDLATEADYLCEPHIQSVYEISYVVSGEGVFTVDGNPYPLRKDMLFINRVAYVSNKDVAMDDYGNEIPPTPDQATYTQIYTVVKTADGWALTSIAQET